MVDVVALRAGDRELASGQEGPAGGDSRVFKLQFA